MSRLFGSPLIQVRVHGSCKRDDAVFDGYTNVFCRGAKIPAQFGEYVGLNLLIRTSKRGGCHGELSPLMWA
jgi:hypothetical protein